MTPIDDEQTAEANEAATVAETAEETKSPPGIEEGPHLKDPRNRAAKLQQMIKAGMTADDEGLTDDMRAILREG